MLPLLRSNAPKKTPISSPIAPPPMTPMVAFAPQELDIHEKSGGKLSAGVADSVQGSGYGRAFLVSEPRLYSLLPSCSTGRCIAARWL